MPTEVTQNTPHIADEVRRLALTLFGTDLEGTAEFIWVPVSFLNGIRFFPPKSDTPIEQVFQISENIFATTPFEVTVDHRFSPPQMVASRSGKGSSYVLFAGEPPLSKPKEYLFSLAKESQVFALGVTASTQISQELIDHLITHAPVPLSRRVKPMILLRKTNGGLKP